MTIESAIVTRVWRRSSPCMKRKIAHLHQQPDQRRAGEARGERQQNQPVYCAAK